MNKIIERVLQELSKDEPRLDYVRGALETVLEMQVVPKKDYTDDTAKLIPKFNEMLERKEEPKDEGQVLDAMTRARIEKVKALAEKSTELA